MPRPRAATIGQRPRAASMARSKRLPRRTRRNRAARRPLPSSTRRRKKRPPRRPARVPAHTGPSPRRTRHAPRNRQRWRSWPRPAAARHPGASADAPTVPSEPVQPDIMPPTRPKARRLPAPATANLMGTTAKATGPTAGAMTHTRRHIIMQACIGSMVVTATTARSAPGQVMAGEPIVQAGITAAGMDTTRRATDTMAIVTTRNSDRES